LLAAAIFFFIDCGTPSLAAFFHGGDVWWTDGGQVVLLDGPDQPPPLQHADARIVCGLPHLDRLTSRIRVVSGMPLPPAYYLQAGLYAAGYAACCWS